MNVDEAARLLGQPLEASPLFEFSDRNWRPTFGSIEGRVAVHVCATEELGPAVEKRIASAMDAGVRVSVVLDRGLISLTNETQAFLLRMPVSIMVSRDPTEADLRLYRDMGSAIIAHELLLDIDIARLAIADKLETAVLSPLPEKGDALEDALCLALSQVPGFVIHDVNRRTANEELDIIVANNSSRSPWNGSPLILVEAKNWSRNVDRVEYDALYMKVQERGGLVKIAFLVAATGFSTGLLMRASSFGTHGISIVPVKVPKLIEELRGGMGIEAALAERVFRVAIVRVWED